MVRSMQKYIEEYYERFGKKKTTLGSIVISDITQIYDMGLDTFRTISVAMEAGFMIGYKCAQGRAKAARAKAGKAAAADPRLQLIAHINKQLEKAAPNVLEFVYMFLLRGRQ